MNFKLTHIPTRTSSPREEGLTMVMDKGLSINEAKNMITASAKHIDIVKLGFGTAYVTENLEEKIKLYTDAGLNVYFGGTLFEAFIIRDMFDEFVELVEKFDLKMVEVSDGSIELDHEKKM